MMHETAKTDNADCSDDVATRPRRANEAHQVPSNDAAESPEASRIMKKKRPTRDMAAAHSTHRNGSEDAAAAAAVAASSPSPSAAMPAADMSPTTVSANQDFPHVLSPHARQPSGIDPLGATMYTDMGSLSGTYFVSPNTPTPNVVDTHSPANTRRRHGGDVGGSPSAKQATDSTGERRRAARAAAHAETESSGRVVMHSSKTRRPQGRSNAADLVREKHRQRVRAAQTGAAPSAHASADVSTTSQAVPATDPANTSSSSVKRRRPVKSVSQTNGSPEEDTNDAENTAPAAARAYDKPWLTNASTRHVTPLEGGEEAMSSHSPSRTASSLKTSSHARAPAHDGAGSRRGTTSSSASGSGSGLMRPTASSQQHTAALADARAQREATRPTRTRTRRGEATATATSEPPPTRTRRPIKPTSSTASATRSRDAPLTATPAKESADVSMTSEAAPDGRPPTLQQAGNSPNKSGGSGDRTALQAKVARSVEKTLYEGIYQPFTTCEVEEVPPVFERPLSYYEQQMIWRHKTDAVAHYQIAMARRKKVLQQENALMPLTMYGGVAGGAVVEDLNHMARVVRYCLEEENWRIALDALSSYEILCASLLAPTFRVGEAPMLEVHKKSNSDILFVQEEKTSNVGHHSPDHTATKVKGEGVRLESSPLEGSSLPRAASENSSISLQFRIEDPSGGTSAAPTPAAQAKQAAKARPAAKRTSSHEGKRLSSCTKEDSTKSSPTLQQPFPRMSDDDHTESMLQARQEDQDTQQQATKEKDAESHCRRSRTSPEETQPPQSGPTSRARAGRRRGPVTLPTAPTVVCPVMQLASFSRFEVVQELKRMIWWSAVHRLTRFSVAVGVVSAADNLSTAASSFASPGSPVESACATSTALPVTAPSPVLYPAAHPNHHKYHHGQQFSVFYDTVVLLLYTDKWLQKRAELFSRSRVEGLITISIKPDVLEEARRADWARFRDCGKPRLEKYVQQVALKRENNVVDVPQSPLLFGRGFDSSMVMNSSMVGTEFGDTFTDMGSPISRSASPPRARRRDLPTASALTFFS